jgi:hypothetical protein
LGQAPRGLVVTIEGGGKHKDSENKENKEDLEEKEDLENKEDLEHKEDSREDFRDAFT